MASHNFDVCMLAENSFRNDSRVLREARSLARHGLRVQLLALWDPGQEPVEQVEGFQVRRLRVRLRALRARWALGLKGAEFVARLLWSALASKARVYHAHHPLVLLPAVIAAKVRRARLVYDCHELATGMPGQSRFQRRALRWYEGALVRFVDGVIMSDGASRGEAFRAAHGYRGPIVSVYNCPVLVEVAGCREDLRAALDLPRNARLVIYTGAVGPARGLEETIESMPRWPPDAHCAIIGMRTESEEQRLRALAKARGVAGRVHFFGPVPPDQVAPWAASADLGLVLIQNASLSYYYSAPTKMFEMIMARVPQVASDFPEIRRVVVSNPVGPLGEVVDPADPQAIAEAVCRILTDSAAHETYRRNADALARARYNWAVEERTLLDLYGGLLRADGPTP
ncbi:MAG: glycosyltransferase family 4 protein [Chloroflexi bacterium]|nr:glycosyltransferase family 4 protein [Chloroflexota bacterium]